MPRDDQDIADDPMGGEAEPETVSSNFCGCCSAATGAAPTAALPITNAWLAHQANSSYSNNKWSTGRQTVPRHTPRRPARSLSRGTPTPSPRHD
jgi:hypothetical protein